MELNVQIISEEIIKPSSPTPPQLRIYKLSIFDQLAPQVYAPIILFYSAAGDNDPSKRSHHLKNSLSKTLTKFYPFAGRVKDGFSIECNDHGAMYIETHVDCDMYVILKQPEIHQLQRLLPHNTTLEKPPEPSTEEMLLVVQVNYFSCGGMAVSVCIRHVIADASAAANFVKCWAAIASDANFIIDDVISDCSTLFPPHNFFGFSKNITKNHNLLADVAMKRFLFDGSKIASLRETIGNLNPSLDPPTRVEAISSLIWSAVIRIARDRDETMPIHVATTAVNLRRRMNPPLPQRSIGNIYQMTLANWPMEKTTNYNNLAGKIHESVRKMNDEYIRKLHAGGGYLSLMRNAAEELGKSGNIEVFSFSSWCRFPFYEADFGWGKPVWLSTALKLNRVAIFLDTSDGKGIEAWVGLSKQSMDKFERDPDILAYASFSASNI